MGFPWNPARKHARGGHRCPALTLSQAQGGCASGRPPASSGPPQSPRQAEELAHGPFHSRGSEAGRAARALRPSAPAPACKLAPAPRFARTTSGRDCRASRAGSQRFPGEGRKKAKATPAPRRSPPALRRPRPARLAPSGSVPHCPDPQNPSDWGVASLQPHAREHGVSGLLRPGMGLPRPGATRWEPSGPLASSPWEPGLNCPVQPPETAPVGSLRGRQGPAVKQGLASPKCQAEDGRRAPSPACE